MNYEKSKPYRIRLQREYELAMDLNQVANGLLVFEPAPGEEVPYVEKYIVTFNFPTWVKDGSEIRRQQKTRVNIEMRGIKEPLLARIPDGDPIPYHPNWFKSGIMDHGYTSDKVYELISFTEIVFEILQFREDRINPHCPSNNDANEYWKRNKDSSDLFPTDTHAFPALPKSPTIKIIGIK